MQHLFGILAVLLSTTSLREPLYYNEYSHWATRFDKAYATNEELDESYRNFVESLELVKNHTPPLYDVELNEFADTPHRPGLVHTPKQLVSNDEVYLAPYFDTELPDAFDWVSKGAVLPTRSQGQCGSCFAFSATGSLSGQYYLKTGKLVRFSESQLVDCSGDFGDDGCNGGLQVNCFKYYGEHGAELEVDYPYTPKDGECEFQEGKVVVKVKSYKQVWPGEHNLKMALYHYGPLSIQMDASRRSFQLYKRGIYSDPECSNVDMDHAVLLVGWGEDHGTKYWTVQNSWGGSWGLDFGGGGGYFRIDIAHDCGILESGASYPELL